MSENPDMQGAFRTIVSQFEQWRERAIPLRHTEALGRISVLSEDDQHWIPIAREVTKRV
jgi:hypothetical protein